MEESKLTVAFIPVRGGSKSITKKNIITLNGYPLIYYTLTAASKCNSIDKIFVSTDDHEISSVVNNLNIPKVQTISRSPETATDSASTESAMLEFANNFDFSTIVLIQATSPLTESYDLEIALKRFHENSFDSMVSLVNQKKFIWSADSEVSRALNFDPSKRPLRQEWQGYFVENGAFYITNKNGLLTSGCRVSGRVGHYIMSDVNQFEIDEPDDLAIIENLLKRRKSSELKILPGVKVIATDVDGVMTNGKMCYSNDGNESKDFNTRDGMAFELLRQVGIKVGIVTSEDTTIVANRAEKIKADFLFQGIKDKKSCLESYCFDNNLTLSEVLFIGDDLNDLEIMKACGYSVCPNDAVEIIRKAAKYVAKANGGQGVVREVFETFFQEKRSFGLYK